MGRRRGQPQQTLSSVGTTAGQHSQKRASAQVIAAGSQVSAFAPAAAASTAAASAAAEGAVH